MKATHDWLDIRMKVIGYDPISSDQRWKMSNLKLGDAVYAVIHHFQLSPREFMMCLCIVLIRFMIYCTNDDIILTCFSIYIGN